MELTGATAVEVACSGPPSSGDPGIMVLSGTSDEVELAGRATVFWKKLRMPKRTAARRRVLEGILGA